MDEEVLYLSDDKLFYTLEGEGRYVGYPSVFMRLSMCNLTCQGFKSKDSPFGCDSYISWSKKNRFTFDQIFELMEKEGYVENLKQGAIFKLTGGEPFIQQKKLFNFILAFKNKYNFTPRIDFETNGTIQPIEDWVYTLSSTFTVSPKLSNNGDPEEKRYKLDVLKYHVSYNACFKFVVKDEYDMQEIYDKYITPLNLKKDYIWLMPCCGSRQEQNEISEKVADICKKHSIKFSPRLQLMIWDKALRA